MMNLLKKICLCVAIFGVAIATTDNQQQKTPKQRIEEIKKLVTGEQKDLIENLKKTNDLKYPDDQYVVCFEKETTDGKETFKRIIHINQGKVGEQISHDSDIGKIVQKFFENTKNEKDVLVNYEIDGKKHYAHVVAFLLNKNPCVCAVTALGTPTSEPEPKKVEQPNPQEDKKVEVHPEVKKEVVSKEQDKQEPEKSAGSKITEANTDKEAHKAEVK